MNIPNPKLVARINSMQCRFRIAKQDMQMKHIQFEAAVKLYQMSLDRKIDKDMKKLLRLRVDKTRGAWWTAIDKKMVAEMEIRKLNRQILADMEAQRGY